MEIKKYEAFMLATELGSFSKAADKLGITQSGLTHMMNSLEKEIGFPVLIRDFNGVKFTPNGEKLVPCIKKLIQSSNDLNDEISFINETAKRTITIGSYTSISIAWVLPIIKNFSRDYPDINIEIRGGTIDENYNWVREGLVDLSFASNQFDPDMQWIHLAYDPFVAVLPSSYNVVSERFDIRQFNSKQILMPYFGFEKDVMRELNKYEITPIFRPTVVDDEVILKMVEAGLGVSILSQLILTNKNYNVIAMELNPPMYRDLGIIAKDYKNMKDFVKTFIEYAKDFTKNM